MGPTRGTFCLSATPTHGGPLRKFILAFLAVLTVATVTGAALADDPNGHLATAQGLLDQAQAEIDAAIAEPPTTVTETATITTTTTATVTQTVTPTTPPPTTPSPTTPPPTTPPPPTCTGVQVAAGANLTTVLANNPAGTTFCLAAGNYTVGSPQPTLQAGDQLIGQGKTQTVIKANVRLSNMFSYSGVESGLVTFKHLGMGNVFVDLASTTCNGNCGGILLALVRVNVDDVACFDNGALCFGGGVNNSTFNDLDCYGNGYHPDSLKSDFQSSSCLKLNRTGSFSITNSYFHDNFWDAVWFDFADGGANVVTGNTFVHNGRGGVTVEMTGDLAVGDSTLVRNNVFQDNGWNTQGSGWWDVNVSDSADVEIDHNTTTNANIGVREPDGTTCCAFVRIIVVAGRAPQPMHDVYIHDNTLNGTYINSCSRSGVTCTNNT